MSTVQEAPTAPARPPDEPARPVARPFSFDAATFGRMLDAEVFGDEDRVELWDGWIVEKMAKTQPHAAAGIRMIMTLVPVLPPGWSLSAENPVALGPKLVPPPAFAVLRGDKGAYDRRRPEPRDVGLLVELSYTSLQDDLGPRLAACAGAGIPAHWVLNLVDHTMIVFERPVPAEGRYETVQTYAVGQSIPFRLDGVPIAEVSAIELLPVRA